MASGGRDNWNAVCDGVENRVLPEWMSNYFIALEAAGALLFALLVDLKVSAISGRPLDSQSFTEYGYRYFNSLLRPVLISDTLHLGMNLCLWEPRFGLLPLVPGRGGFASC